MSSVTYSPLAVTIVQPYDNTFSAIDQPLDHELKASVNRSPSKKGGIVKRLLSLRSTYTPSSSASSSSGASTVDDSEEHHTSILPRRRSVRQPKKEVNTLAGKYGVCEKRCIGEGATAVVRLAHKTEGSSNMERLFAVKEFRKRSKDETEKEYMRKLAAEFCISSSLHHVNVVETVDFIQDEEDRWCEVMEYCPGGDLFSIIKDGSMAKEDVYCTFKQTIHGLAYIHSMGVAHRDIKPENLLIDDHGHVKITDFGVSDVFKMCWEKEVHLSKGKCGSEPYIAPEIFSQKEYDARASDIWACGIVLYTMLFQEIPFRMATKQDANFLKYLQLADKANFEPFKKLEPECRSLLLKILDPCPETRIKMEDILQNEWFQSIEVCDDDCQAPSKHHSHFTDEYNYSRMSNRN